MVVLEHATEPLSAFENLLLTMVVEATEGRQQDVPWLEYGRLVQRRKSTSVLCQRMKSSHRDATFWRRQYAVFYGISSSAEFFDPTGANHSQRIGSVKSIYFSTVTRLCDCLQDIELYKVLLNESRYFDLSIGSIDIGVLR